MAKITVLKWHMHKWTINKCHSQHTHMDAIDSVYMLSFKSWCEIHKGHMNSDMTVHTEVALQNTRPVSDSGSQLKVAHIWIEKIRFSVPFEHKTKSVWATCPQCQHRLSVLYATTVRKNRTFVSVIFPLNFYPVFLWHPNQHQTAKFKMVNVIWCC